VRIEGRANVNVSPSRISKEVGKIETARPTVKIVNVVASGSLKHGIDLRAVHGIFPETEYDPKKFPGLVFRLKRPKTSSLLFSSGKIICTGGKSEKTAASAIRKIARMLKKQGIVIKGSPTIKIQNIVASLDLGGSVSLLDLYMKSGRRGSAMYEPDQFPGLIYRMKGPSVVLLLFSTGKAVCAGAKNEEHVYHATEKISQILEKHNVIAYS
jgi:transcription initiation factor TFIID TATA-box-binding protein